MYHLQPPQSAKVDGVTALFYGSFSFRLLIDIAMDSSTPFIKHDKKHYIPT